MWFAGRIVTAVSFNCSIRLTVDLSGRVVRDCRWPRWPFYGNCNHRKSLHHQGSWLWRIRLLYAGDFISSFCWCSTPLCTPINVGASSINVNGSTESNLFVEATTNGVNYCATIYMAVSRSMLVSRRCMQHRISLWWSLHAPVNRQKQHTREES